MLTGDVLFNELRIRRVNKRTGYAKQLSLSATVPGLGDVNATLGTTDAEFRGLNRETGSGSEDQIMQVRASSNARSLIPTFGLDVPFTFSAGRRSAIPKFFPDNDVLLFDESLQDSPHHEG